MIVIAHGIWRHDFSEIAREIECTECESNSCLLSAPLQFTLETSLKTGGEE